MDISKFYANSLTDEQSANNLSKYGKNSIVDTLKVTPLQHIFNQVRSPLILFLAVIALIMIALEEFSDAIVISIVVIVNTIVGYLQEVKAQNAVESLKNYIAPKSKVIRNGYLVTIDSSLLTVDDIVVIETGDRIPADGVVLQSKNLQLEEAQLTGEAFPVAKKDGAEVFMGTFATTGRGIMKIQNVGMHTKLGQITKVVSRKDKDKTPLEKDLHKLNRKIIVLVFFVISLMIVLGVLEGINLEEIVRSAISLGISAIPEGLPVVITITLAIGVYRMGKQNAIIRNLASASTLASTDVICIDKTGTITEGNIKQDKLIVLESSVLTDKTDNEIIKKTVLCNDAYISTEEGGDLLDLAILKYAQDNQLSIEQVRSEHPRIDEIPFDSDFKYQVTLNNWGDKQLIILKGAVDVIIEKCKFDDSGTKKIVQEYFEQLGEQGFRTIGLASKETQKNSIGQDDLADMKFEAILTFSDPIRTDVNDALEKCRKSGIKIIMITGDHKNIAQSIALQTGILTENGVVVQGELLEQDLKDKKFNIHDLNVIYRATPSDKSWLVSKLVGSNLVTAMTGDGVNDAPALVKADIGIAMGKGGTDVAKESADMVLLDNKFSTIVSGLEEARVVFENLRKVIAYLFMTSVGEVVAIMLSLFLGFPLPLVGSQILWLNLITDGLLDMTIATEPKEDGIMNYSSSRYKKGILDSAMLKRIVFYGIIMGVGALIFFRIISLNSTIEYARTSTLVFLAIPQWFIAIMIRSETKSIFKLGFFKNKLLLAAIVIEIILLFLAVYSPFMNSILKTEGVDFTIWIYGIAFGIFIFIVDEIRKIIINRK